MSTVSSTPPSTSSTPTSQKSASFDAKLDIAKSSQILVDYLKDNGKSAINADELSRLANAPADGVSAEVSAAADYMTRHSDVFTAIETHDVPGADNLSGVWNLEWAAQGGLKGTATEAIAKMTDTFDLAIAKSAEITQITTGKKAELDATKQRPQS
jgi:hypothetical protein